MKRRFSDSTILLVIQNMILEILECGMKSVLTTCGYCGCGCNFYVKVHDERIIGILPKPDHPVSLGMLCAKGWLGHGFVHHYDRLRCPKIRLKDGTFKDVTWDFAIDVIAKKWLETRTYEPQSFAVFSSARCTNEENYLATKLARSVMQTPHIDHCARL